MIVDRLPVIKAKLPHPLVQNAIFAACKGGVEEPLVNPDHGEDRSVVFKTVNATGDVMLVVSPRRLKTNPDMGVFLAGVALAQKYMPTQTEEDWKNIKINVTFPVREFYDLVAPGELRPKASKNRLWFEESLCTLAKTSISVTFGDPGIGKHGGNLRYQMQSSLWDYKFCPLRGRSGGTIVLSILSDFVPRDYYVWADAALCNRLESQVSREIFWQLIGREHFRIDVSTLSCLCGVSPQSRLDKWDRRALQPALEELSSCGYRIEREGTGTDSVYVLSRNAAKEKRKTANSKGRGRKRRFVNTEFPPINAEFPPINAEFLPKMVL